MTDLKKRPKVVIVGAGFAGLHAAKGLADLPVEITLIDRRNHHTFQPLLYQVATATLSPANIAQPIRTILRDQPNVMVLMDAVVGFDMEGSRVLLRDADSLPFDYLIVATGARNSYFGNDHWAQFAPGLKTIEDALDIRRRILSAFEVAEKEMLEHGKHAPLNFVVIGGGPTGVELAGAIAETCTICMRKEYRLIDPAKARVLLVEGLPNILAPYPEDLQKKAVEQLKDMGVEILTSTKVTDITENRIETSNGPIDTSAIIWAAGVQASPLGKMLGVETDRRGAVIVDEFLNPPGHPKIFVCGDLAHAEQDGRPLPGVAPCAMQMGTHVATEIASDILGKPRLKFHYYDRGDMATIGRRRAVANVKWPFRAHFSGFAAWLSWLLIHLLFLIGLRNRIIVAIEWMWTFFARERGVRLITGEATDALHQAANANTLFQVSTSAALVEGIYRGAISVAQLLEHGNMGLGTFEDLDGEMIVEGGEVFQARADGSVHQVDLQSKTPFAVISQFNPSDKTTLAECHSLDDLKKQFDGMRQSQNLFYALRVRGEFASVHLRAVCKQEEGAHLVDAAAAQSEFKHQNITGTLVGFWSPEYAKTLNVPGYHLHFISKEHKTGGHVLNVAGINLQLELQPETGFTVVLPKTDEFLAADLTHDPTADLAKAENAPVK